MNPPILSIQMVPGGVELVLKALGKLPIEEAGALFSEIKGQAEYQLQQLSKSQAEAPQAEEPQTEGETQ